jgi:hypothetical protein
VQAALTFLSTLPEVENDRLQPVSHDFALPWRMM